MMTKHVICAGLLWLAIGWGVTLTGHHAAPTQMGLLAGWLIAGASSLTAFALLAWSYPRRLQSALGAFAVGFLIRMVLLAVGLFRALRLGANPLWFTAGFFGTYLPLQVLEITGAVAALKRQRLSSAAGLSQ